MKVYRVPHWQDNFESSKSKTFKQCTHAYVPNKQHGMGFTFILSQADGAAILGVWYLIVEALSMQALPRQGYCTDTGSISGRPWTPESMALRWRRKPEEIARAISVLCSEPACWLTVTEVKDTAVSLHSPCDALLTGSDLTGSDKNRPLPYDGGNVVFRHPSPEEVRAYSIEIGYPLDGEGWCDAYAQKGWMVGKSKMKDWKAALRNWKRSGYKLAVPFKEPKKPTGMTPAEQDKMLGDRVDTSHLNRR